MKFGSAESSILNKVNAVIFENLNYTRFKQNKNRINSLNHLFNVETVASMNLIMTTSEYVFIQKNQKL